MNELLGNLPESARLPVIYLVIALASALGSAQLYRTVRTGHWFGWSAGIVALVVFAICAAMAWAVGAQAAAGIAGGIGITAAFMLGHEISDKRRHDAQQRDVAQRARQAAEPPANIVDRERRQRRVASLALKCEAAHELEECVLATASIAAAQQKIAQAAVAISGHTNDLQMAKQANDVLAAATGAYDVAMQIRHTLERIPVSPTGQ